MTFSTELQNGLIGAAGAGADYLLSQQTDMIAVCAACIAAVPAIIKFETPDSGFNLSKLLPLAGGALLCYSAYNGFKNGAEITAIVAKAAAGLMLLFTNYSDVWITDGQTDKHEAKVEEAEVIEG